MSNDAVNYSYVNIGCYLDSSEDGTGYIYTNTIDPGYASVLGVVKGFAAAPMVAEAYSHVNVGFFFDSSDDGVAYVYWNQLEQASGAGRTLEDSSPRDLEDGTQRTLE